jgi:hypothetical protein
MSIQSQTRASYLGWSNPLAWWWAVLAMVSGVNIAVWCWLYYRFHAQPAGSLDSRSGLELVLCAAYVFGCAFRSFLPRADVQRICLFDTWLSNVLVGRSVATVAELCFAAQWVLVLQQLGEATGAVTALNAARMVMPFIIIAECVSWYAVLTRNNMLHGIENSLWAIAFSAVGIGFCRLLFEFDGVARGILVVAIVGIAGYLAFLITVDVPMYFARWRAKAGGAKRLRPLEGLREVSARCAVTHDLAEWREEILWMSLYFSAGVWASLALCVFGFHV